MLSNLHKSSNIILKQNCETDALVYSHFKNEITEVEVNMDFLSHIL